MAAYELTNNQRRYFGLTPISNNWERTFLSDTLIVYYDNNNTIVKVLNYGFGYCEYDTEIRTRQRNIILPKTSRGKELKLTIPGILKIKGSGIQFSCSFQGGGTNVYDNRRNVFFIKSFPEDGDFKTYADLDKWIKNYTANLQADYFDWLSNELSLKKLRIKFREGDFIAFKISKNQYGFARILVDVFSRKKGQSGRDSSLYGFHSRSLIVATYVHFAEKMNIDLDVLSGKKMLPAICIFDFEVRRGEMPIIGNQPLSETENKIPLPKERSTYLTIPYTKKNIETFDAIIN